MRLDRWIRNNLGKFPQGFIEKNLRNGKIKVNNKKIKSSFKIKTGDEINLYNLQFKNNLIQKDNKFKPSKKIIKSNEELIIDNNEDFVVINKAAGISVQGGTKSKKNLIDIFTKSTIFDNIKPYSVHRLDKDTSGLLIIAKNRPTAQLLTSLFRLRKIHKTYIALCYGEIIENKGQWNDELFRYENNKKIFEKALTHYKVIDKNSFSTLLQLKPITGRKHQLRKQLYQNGNPIFGDNKYKFNYSKNIINKKLMLHAYEIKFIINEKKYTYTAPLPEYFIKLMRAKRLLFTNYLKSF
jgi:23S rRNA pseudouridine955/2504/2580 synthase